MRRYLLKEWKEGGLPAKGVCTIAYLATAAGARGVGDLAMDPKKPGQHHADLIEKALGANKKNLYKGRVPIWDKATNERIVVDFPVRLPHEAFAREFEANPDEFKVSEDEVKELPKNFVEHPVTIAHPGRTAPWAISATASRTPRRMGLWPSTGQM